MIKSSIKFLRNLFVGRGHGTRCWKKKFGSYGERCEIEYPVILLKQSNIFIGDNTTICKGARLQNYFDEETKDKGIFIGNNCYLGYNLSILNSGKVVIGDSVLSASNVLISSENHGMNPELEIEYMNQELTNDDVIISDGVWIGQNVCILPGVSIGKKSIIGAGSIVTKSIPDYCIAVGNPARVIKKYDFKEHKWVSIKECKEDI